MKSFRSMIGTGIVLSLIINMGLAGTAIAEYSPTFSDVPETDPNFAAIEYLAAKEVLEGHEDGTFLPADTVNRAEEMKILVVGKGEDPDANLYKDCYPDVKDQWFARYVCYATEEGWVGGYPDGYFKPSDPVNKAESTKMVVNSQGYGDEVESAKMMTDSQTYGQTLASTDELPYVDTASDDWFTPYIEVAKNYNLLEETGAYFSPSEDMTRAGVSENIFRSNAIEVSGQSTYNKHARSSALEEEGLSELISDKELIVADTYTIEADGSFTTYDYHTDEDGVFSLDSYSNLAYLVVADSYDLNTELEDASAKIIVEDYTLDDDGIVNLTEYEDRSDEWVVIFVVYEVEAETGDVTIDGTEVAEVELEDAQDMEDGEVNDGDDDGGDDSDDGDDGDDSDDSDDGDDEDDGKSDDDFTHSDECLDYYENTLGYTIGAASTYRCEWERYEGTAKYVFDYYEEYTDTYESSGGSTDTRATDEVFVDTAEITEYEFTLIYLRTQAWQPDTSTTDDHSDYYWKDIYEWIIIEDITGTGTYSYDYDSYQYEETLWYDGELQIETIDKEITAAEVEVTVTQTDLNETDGTFFENYEWDDDGALLEEVEGAIAFELSVSLEDTEDLPGTQDFYADVTTTTSTTYTDNMFEDGNYSTYDEDEWENYFNTTVQIRGQWEAGEYMSGGSDYSNDSGCFSGTHDDVVGTCQSDIYTEWEIWPEGYFD